MGWGLWNDAFHLPDAWNMISLEHPLGFMNPGGLMRQNRPSANTNYSFYAPADPASIAKIASSLLRVRDVMNDLVQSSHDDQSPHPTISYLKFVATGTISFRLRQYTNLWYSVRMRQPSLQRHLPSQDIGANQNHSVHGLDPVIDNVEDIMALMREDKGNSST